MNEEIENDCDRVGCVPNRCPAKWRRAYINFIGSRNSTIGLNLTLNNRRSLTACWTCLGDCSSGFDEAAVQYETGVKECFVHHMTRSTDTCFAVCKPIR
jgi:hypothetical protein